MALIAATAPAWAQEDYRVEVFGGYVNQRGDGADKRNGWIASETVYIRPWIGVTAEFAGLYRDQDVSFPSPFSPTPVEGELDDDQQSYLFGPRFRFFSRERFAVSAHGLFGVGRTERDFLTPFDPGCCVITSLTRYHFAGAVGLAFDVHLSERFSWRIQPDWYFIGTDAGRSSFRGSTGVVFRFGR